MAIKVLLALWMLMIIPGVFAEPESGQKPAHREDFWLGPGGEIALYSLSGIAYGRSFALGYGDKTMIGLKAGLFFTPEGIDVMEINFMYRIYFSEAQANSGFFVQFTAGPVLFNPKEGISLRLGTINAGLGAGLRFLIMNRVFLEPSIRVGYPFLLGAGISTGVSFKAPRRTSRVHSSADDGQETDDG